MVSQILNINPKWEPIAGDDRRPWRPLPGGRLFESLQSVSRRTPSAVCCQESFIFLY